MGLKTMSLLAGATVSATGGSALAFSNDGVSIQNGLHLSVPGEAFAGRRQCTVKYRAAVLDPKTGMYGKDKKSMSLSRPVTLTDGRIVFETIRIEREMHPLTTDADAVEMNKLGAQLLTDSDTAAFWSAGSLE